MKLGRAAIVGALVAGALSGAASAQELGQHDFMGVEIGSEFTMPECETTKTLNFEMYISDFEQRVRPCWKAMRPEQPLPTDPSFEVAFVPAQDKNPIGVNRSKVIVSGGRIAGVIATTGGHRYQADLLEALTQKFGSPSKLDREELQNRMGATFSSSNALWALPGLKVDFTGVSGSIDFGVIFVTDAAGDAHFVTEQAERDAKKSSF